MRYLDNIEMKWPHTHYHKGKRVKVTLRDGRSIIDKFLDNIGRFIILENHRIEKKTVQGMGYFKKRQP